MKISGTMVYYFHVCKRKLWYFSNSILMEQESDLVYMGKVIDESSYAREEKHIQIDGVVAIDYIQDRHTLHEVKKSNKLEAAASWQLKYYLYYLEQRGVKELKGRIDYPVLRKGFDLTLSPEDRKYFAEILLEIEKLPTAPIPARIKRGRTCESCAYYDFCYLS